MKSLIIALALAASTSVFAQEVKGVKLGMTRAEVLELYPKAVNVKNSEMLSIDITIADIKSKYAPDGALVHIDNDKVVGFLFYFNPKDFDNMKDTFKEKYPELSCVDSPVTNRMGAVFTNTKCTYQALRVNRFTGDLDTALVGLTDTEYLMRKADERKKKGSKDL